MTELADTISDELYSQFEWFNQMFNAAVQAGSDDFLYAGIKFKLISVSKSLNTMSQDESYFVTKVKIDPQNEIYIRNSDKAVNAILTRSLGGKKSFDINKITELEAKMITAFNDNLYNFIKDAFTPSYQQQRQFDITNLTFIIKDDVSDLCGKIILTFPTQIVAPQGITSTEEKFSYDYFNESLVDVDIKIGSTVFTVGDLKSLESDDIVLLENSNIQTMRVNYKGYEKDFRITPNPALIISVDNSGGEEMGANMPSGNIWDSIQVEMGAEFDKVKISLGELKNIEQGLVVDISSIYNNNVTLKVEEKVIASGELVIINDRYGVKINQVFAEPKQAPMEQEMPQSQEQYGHEQMPEGYHEQIGEGYGEPVGEGYQEQMGEGYGESMGEGVDGEYDYSDFNLEDEDL